MSNKSDQKEVTTEASTDENINEVNAELETLKRIADIAGIKYHPNIGYDNLSERIEEQLAVKEEMKVSESINAAPAEAAPRKVAPSPVPVAPEILASQKRAKQVKEATKLIRIRLTCMNPNKTEWPGEIFTVSNSVVPTQKKYVPFGAEKGWHVPQIILNVIKERKCQIFRTVKRGKKKMREGFLIPEFNIEILPSLTEGQMAELREEQAISGRID